MWRGGLTNDNAAFLACKRGGARVGFGGRMDGSAVIGVGGDGIVEEEGSSRSGMTIGG